MGVFVRMMEGLAAVGADRKTVMIEATYLKALGRLIGRTKDSLNTKLHAITDTNGRSLSFVMTTGQVSDCKGAAALLDDLPKARWLSGDRDYDADWFRDPLQAKGIEPCVPRRKPRLQPVKYDKRRYRRRSRIEIMFGCSKDWRRVATCYDRRPTAFFSAIALAATVIFWLYSERPEAARSDR